jgi:hypothetical protein
MRASLRKEAPSAKAQEAKGDGVQTGRVTKKASLAKTASPAKKSPTKAAEEKMIPGGKTTVNKAGASGKREDSTASSRRSCAVSSMMC